MVLARKWDTYGHSEVVLCFSLLWALTYHPIWCLHRIYLLEKGPAVLSECDWEDLQAMLVYHSRYTTCTLRKTESATSWERGLVKSCPAFP